MPKYKYIAVDSHGRRHKGFIETPNAQLAVDEIRAQNLWLLELIDVAKSILHREIKFGAPRVKTEHFTIFCRQLATMYKAGISLVEAVRILSEQTQSKVFRKILVDVADDMQRGTQFSVAAGAHPSIFSTVFVNMVRAGEASGNLDEMLERLALFFEKEHSTKEKVKSAMVYPAVMGVVTLIVVTLMLTFVIPKFVQNFQAMGLELPLPTRIVIAVSEFIQHYWFLIPILIFIPVLIVKAIGSTERGRYALDLMKLKIPVFGVLWHKQAIARFSRTFSSLFAAAIPMLQAMSIVSKIVGNTAISKLIDESKEGLRSGQSIADPFRNNWVFPPMVVQMMAIGERSGALDTMLSKIADFYEDDVDRISERLKALLEPLMIVVLTVIVGGIVMSVMLPAFKLMSSMSSVS